MNLLTFRFQTIVIVVDTWESGVGFLFSTKIVVSWEIPEYLGDWSHINFLELFGQIPVIWSQKLITGIFSLSCILASGNSSTAQGWLNYSNFRSNDESRTDINVTKVNSCELSSIILQAKSCLYSQCFQEKKTR